MSDDLQVGEHRRVRPMPGRGSTNQALMCLAGVRSIHVSGLFLNGLLELSVQLQGTPTQTQDIVFIELAGAS